MPSKITFYISKSTIHQLYSIKEKENDKNVHFINEYTLSMIESKFKYCC